MKPNENFLNELITQEPKFKLDKILNFSNIVKNSKISKDENDDNKTTKKNKDKENDIRTVVSRFIIDELVARMTLQYDKKEILDKEINIKEFPTEEF